MNKPISILLVEDNPADAILIRRLVRTAAPDFRVTHVATLADSIAQLQANEADVILLDLGLPDSEGMETLARTRAQVPNTPIIVITGTGETELGVKARLGGAQDFYAKEFLDSDLLIRAILRVINSRPI